MKAINYCAVIEGNSGYAHFARGFIRALRELGVVVWVQRVYRRNRRWLDCWTTVPDPSVRSGHEPSTGVKIINTPPDLLPSYREPGCFNVGFTMFEASRLPQAWVDACNTMDAIVVPSQWNLDTFAESGVRVPMKVISPGVAPPTSEYLTHPRPTSDALPLARYISSRPWLLPRTGRSTVHAASQKYTFYSIFQWIERKNPEGLLKAYFSEFSGHTDVRLLLKIHFSPFASRSFPWLEMLRAKSAIAAVKESMQLAHFPEVAPIVGELTDAEIHGLHRTGDCFVLPHRAEGFGLPHFEAMAHGRPVITTAMSGNMEFTKPLNCLLLPFQLTLVCNMKWNSAYQGDMMWAEPDLAALRKHMRHVYEERQFARRLGSEAQSFIFQEFSWKKQATQLLRFLTDLGAGSSFPAAIEGAQPKEKDEAVVRSLSSSTNAEAVTEPLAEPGQEISS